ncbi:MAG: hypothetical protein AB8E15_02055 [Bdellovibrionales bacterium]
MKKIILKSSLLALLFFQSSLIAGESERELVLGNQRDLFLELVNQGMGIASATEILLTSCSPCNLETEAVIAALLSDWDNFKKGSTEKDLKGALDSLNARIEFGKVSSFYSLLLAKKWNLNSVFNEAQMDHIITQQNQLACFYKEELELEKRLSDCEKNSISETINNESNLRELLNRAPSEADSIVDRTRLYMVCRHDRSHPCMKVLRDVNGQWVENEDGSIWSQGSLGYSRKKKPFYKTDGDTPSGVYKLNGVMPSANRTTAFGKFRRIIMDFIWTTNRTNKFLPQSQISKDWWNQANIARDAGRNLFRIHGTGMKNRRTRSNYYPFVGQRGCVSTREGTYDGVKFVDQRKLLDKMMEAQGLDPIYANETKIRSIFYVININDNNTAVTKDEVLSYIEVASEQ